MMSCCCLTYKKYLNTDGSVDNVALGVAIDEVREFALNHGCDQKWIERMVVSAGSCRCDCHVKGTKVLH